MGEGVTMVSIREATDLLNNGLDTLKLEILPISHLQLATIKPPMGKQPHQQRRAVAGAVAGAAEHGFSFDKLRFPANWGNHYRPFKCIPLACLIDDGCKRFVSPLLMNSSVFYFIFKVL